MLVDLEALVRRTVLRAQSPKGSVVLDYAWSVPVVPARPTDLETALLNLLDKALKFSPPGASVTVQVTGRPGEGFVIIDVSDSGPGIPEQDLPRIFERFFTTDAASRHGPRPRDRQERRGRARWQRPRALGPRRRHAI